MDLAMGFEAYYESDQPHTLKLAEKEAWISTDKLQYRLALYDLLIILAEIL